MQHQVFFTRPNKDVAASQEDILRFEKSALSDLGRGKEVYIIELFPRRFFSYAVKIRLEKVVEPIASLPALSNQHLFRVFSTNSIYE